MVAVIVMVVVVGWSVAVAVVVITVNITIKLGKRICISNAHKDSYHRLHYVPKILYTDITK